MRDEPLTAAKEIAETFPVNRSSAYKLFKRGLDTVFVISRLHLNRSEPKVPAVSACLFKSEVTFSLVFAAN